VALNTINQSNQSNHWIVLIRTIISRILTYFQRNYWCGCPCFIHKHSTFEGQRCNSNSLLQSSWRSEEARGNWRCNLCVLRLVLNSRTFCLTSAIGK
jgi:hypothetical protein